MGGKRYANEFKPEVPTCIESGQVAVIERCTWDQYSKKRGLWRRYHAPSVDGGLPFKPFRGRSDGCCQHSIAFITEIFIFAIMDKLC